MKANQFVKKYGFDEVSKQIKKPTGIYGAAFDYQFMDDLKRLVESYELVECMGGLDEAKYILRIAELNGHDYAKTRKAIQDVESCQ